MPDPTRSGDRIAATIDALRQQGASEHDIETYLVEHEGLRPAPPASAAPADATRALPRNRQDASGDYEATAPAVLGTIAAPLRTIPGAEAVASKVRSLVRGQPYSQARNDIRDAVDEAPKALTVPLQIGGAALSAAVLPGGAARSGFLYGAADGLGQSNPDADLATRIDEAGAKGAMYAGLGALGQGVNAVRNLPPGSVGKIGKAMLPAFVKRGMNAAQSLSEVAAPQAVEAAIPQAEGFVGNGMDNVLEAVKAQAQPESNVLSVVKGEAAPARSALSTAADRARWRRAGGSPVIHDGSAEPSLEDLLQQSLQLIHNGGKLGKTP